MCRYLRDWGFNVVGVCRSYPYHPYQRENLKNIVLHTCDILNFDELCRVVVSEGPDIVIHLAALTLIQPSFVDPKPYFDVNFTGTVNVLEASRRANVKLFVLMSTDKVLGNRTNAKEYDPYSPVDPYGFTKMLAEEVALRLYGEKLGLRVLVVRSCNVVGYDLKPRIVPKVVRQCLRGESPVIYRNYKGVRQYIDVRDLVEAIRVLVEANVTGVWHVGTNEIYSQEEVVLKILKHFPNIKPTYVDYNAKWREVEVQWLNWDKIRRELGWKPKYTLDDAIVNVIELVKRFG